MKVIVPITEWKDRFDGAPWMVKIEPDALRIGKVIQGRQDHQVQDHLHRPGKKTFGKVAP